MVYTTPQSVADYIGIPVMDLPDNITIMIRNASELMDYATLNYIQDYYVDSGSFTDTSIENYVELACNAQIEYWIAVGGTSLDITGNSIKYFEIGNFRVDYGATTSGGKMEKQPILAPRAKRHLLLSGLLYRGVGR